MVEIKPTGASALALDDFDVQAGDGCINRYPLFDGVEVLILRLEMQSYIEKRSRIDELEINFCVNGRFESNFSARDHVLLCPGDMAISCFDGKHGAQSESRFPLGYYEGVCLRVNPLRARAWMEQCASAFFIDFSALKRNLLSGCWYAYSQAGPRCEHVFRELYENAAYFDLQYLQLKSIELLMLLSRIPRMQPQRSYCSAKQTELISHLRDHLLSDHEHYISLAQLAAEHGVSVSHLQKLFKQIYGAPIYHYVKEYRLEQAAVELVKSSKSITEIALDAGYDNPSKFTQCFKKRYGSTPSQYRLQAIRGSKRNN